MHLRSLHIAEPSPFDLDVTIAFPRRIADLTADMLTLSITVGPDDERTDTSRQVFDVLGDVLVVLASA
jgi:hypothetical protein